MLGATLGEWGREKYGLKPVKMDVLEYLPQYLAHLREQIKEEAAAARETNAPCAFVTFRCASRQSGPHCHRPFRALSATYAYHVGAHNALTAASPSASLCGQLPAGVRAATRELAVSEAWPLGFSGIHLEG